MTIHLYLRDFPPLAQRLDNGMYKAVHGLAAALSRQKAAVTVLCEGAQDIQRRSDAGYDIRCFALRPGLAGHLGISAGLRSYVQSSIPRDGIVVLNAMFHPGVYHMSRLLSARGVAYVVAAHDPYHPSVFRTNAHLKWPYWYLMERSALRRAAAVQVLDRRHEQWLRRYGVQTPVIEVQNGFEESDVPEESSLRYCDEAPARLCFLGRLDAHNKGLDLLLDAFAGIEPAVDAHLTIQGPDWGDRAMLERRAQSLCLAGRITFADPDFTQSPTSLIAQHDIFCLPSRFEGFSLAALEAMLSARVLLVSDIAGIAPHVRQSGCGVVVDSTVESVRDGIRRLLAARPHWRGMGLRGRRYALADLGWDRVATIALREYQNILAATGHLPLADPASDAPQPGAAIDDEPAELPAR